MTAFSRKDLTDKIRKLHGDKRYGIAEAPAGTRTAIFAVHGVSPIQRYAFQDQVATALEGYLNAQERSEHCWKSVVYWPECIKDSPIDIEGVRPSALRVYRSDERDPLTPIGRIYDVYEGYWSPLSKGKTSVTSALRWLLNATFLGTSSTASIPCTPQKLLSDVRFVVAYLFLALALCGLAFALGWFGWIALANTLRSGGAPGVTYAAMLHDPIRTLFRLPWIVYAEFIVDLMLGYLLAQILVVYKTRSDRRGNVAAVKRDSVAHGHFQKQVMSAHAFHRAVLVILWVLLAVFIIVALILPIFSPHLSAGFNFAASRRWLVLYVLAVTIAVMALQGARALGDFAVENVLGDVQIYTTHDQNSAFYGIRQAIIAAVAAALKGVLNIPAPLTAADDTSATNRDPYYDRIHILGHSLGSTIAMDVLILLRQLIQEDSLADRQWKRIRSLTTFGTALEKTRFFFDVRQPTLNAAQDQWEDDAYGRFFTKDTATLRDHTNKAGIYWSNYWYYHDIVANKIVSYKSDVHVGGDFLWARNPRKICRNFLLKNERPWYIWVHSDYLADPHFWARTGSILTS